MASPRYPLRVSAYPTFPTETYSSRLSFYPPQNAPVATPEDAASNGGGAQPELSPWQQAAERLREVKNVPYLGRALRLAAFRIRDVGALATEGRELVSAYRFARKLDLLILSGSGQLNEEWGGPWGLPYAIFRWAMLAKLAGTPFAVASTGAGMLESRLTRWFLKNALQTACYRSYRDEGTKALLTHWEFTRNDPIVRDMAFSLDPTPYLSARRKSDPQRVVAVSPINFGNPPVLANAGSSRLPRLCQGPDRARALAIGGAGLSGAAVQDQLRGSVWSCKTCGPACESASAGTARRLCKR